MKTRMFFRFKGIKRYIWIVFLLKINTLFSQDNPKSYWDNKTNEYYISYDNIYIDINIKNYNDFYNVYILSEDGRNIKYKYSVSGNDSVYNISKYKHKKEKIKNNSELKELIEVTGLYRDSINYTFKKIDSTKIFEKILKDSFKLYKVIYNLYNNKSLLGVFEIRTSNIEYVEKQYKSSMKIFMIDKNTFLSIIRLDCINTNIAGDFSVDKTRYIFGFF